MDLIEAGLQSKEMEKERFFALAEKLTQTKDPKERKRLREELAVMKFRAQKVVQSYSAKVPPYFARIGNAPANPAAPASMELHSESLYSESLALANMQPRIGSLPLLRSLPVRDSHHPSLISSHNQFQIRRL